MKTSTIVPALALCLTLSGGATAQADWFQGTFEEGLAAAAQKKSGLAFVYFWQDGSEESGNFYQQTLQSSAINSELGNFLCYSAMGGQAGGDALFQRFGIERLPSVLFVQPDGTVIDAMVGFQSVTDLIAELQRIGKGVETIPALRASVEAKPDDLDAIYKLALKLRDAGNSDDYQELVAVVKEKDPKGKTEAGGHIQLLGILEEVYAQGAADAKLKPLRDFLVKQKNKRVLFLGYDQLANIEYNRENLKGAIQATKRAWKSIPDDEVRDWGNRIVGIAWLKREDLSPADCKLVLTIAKKATKKAEKTNQMSVADYDSWLAWRLYTLAAAYHMNSKRKECLATMDRAIKLYPDSEELKKVLEGFKSGNIRN